MKAQALRAQAAQDRAAASASRIGGYVGAGATLLTGGWRASGGFGLGSGSGTGRRSTRAASASTASWGRSDGLRNPSLQRAQPGQAVPLAPRMDPGEAAAMGG